MAYPCSHLYCNHTSNQKQLQSVEAFLRSGMINLLFLASLGSGSVSAAAEPSLTGTPSVIDADTLELHGTRVRLEGVDAPEGHQTCLLNGNPWRCGQAAALALADHIGGRALNCKGQETDRYGRTLAVCWLGSEDLNAWLVAEGWALAYRRYSSAYVGQERAAQQAKRGIWASVFVPPWVWRKNQ